jgi:hypothetical protein
LVEAADAAGRLASYSNCVDSEFASVARHFGGESETGRSDAAVFDGMPGTYGTSFAAPFVAAAAYAYQVMHGPGVSFDTPKGVVDFGAFCAGRLEVPIRFEPASAQMAGAGAPVGR